MQAFKAKVNAGFSVSAGRTIDTDARRKAMKAKQEADRKKAAAAAQKAKDLAKKKEAARKANQAKYNALNKTAGGSSKLIKKTPPPQIKDPFAGREKKTGGGLFGLFGKKK